MPDNRFDKGYLNYIQNQNKPKYNKFTRKAKKEYGDDFDLNEQGYMNLFDETRPGQQYYTPPGSTSLPNVPWNPYNQEGNSVRPEPGRGGMILPEGGRTWNKGRDIIGEKIRLEELYNESVPQGGFNINEGLFSPGVDTSYVKKEGGQVLKSFKSAARFDQPKFKNGRRTKG